MSHAPKIRCLAPDMSRTDVLPVPRSYWSGDGHVRSLAPDVSGSDVS